MIRENGHSYSEYKYFKQIVVSYFEYCSYDAIEEIYALPEVKYYYRKMMNDKFYWFILLMLLKRKFKPFVTTFCSGPTKNYLTSLLRTRYFKFLITKSKLIDNTELLSRIHHAFASVPLQCSSN